MRVNFSSEQERLTHGSWAAMRKRCGPSAGANAKNYRDKGITVCEQWAASFEAFVKDVGMRPTISHSIDRINNAGNYEPGNVRWATKREQAQNRSTANEISYRGETLCVTEWARRLGTRDTTIARRLESGWSVSETLETLPGAHLLIINFNGETRSAEEWSKHLGLSPGVVSNRLRSGWSITDALTFSKERSAVGLRPQKMRIHFRGEQRWLPDLAIEFSMSLRQIRKRLGRGWDIERALSQEPQQRTYPGTRALKARARRSE